MKSEAETPRVAKNHGGTLSETFDIHARLLRNPYGMVAGAMGIGFVLGGGFFTRLTARIVGTGLRIGLMAALPILQKEIVQALTGTKPTLQQETDR
jgi:hypothetical protein